MEGVSPAAPMAGRLSRSGLRAWREYGHAASGSPTRLLSVRPDGLSGLPASDAARAAREAGLRAPAPLLHRGARALARPRARAHARRARLRRARVLSPGGVRRLLPAAPRSLHRVRLPGPPDGALPS